MVGGLYVQLAGPFTPPAAFGRELGAAVGAATGAPPGAPPDPFTPPKRGPRLRSPLPLSPPDPFKPPKREPRSSCGSGSAVGAARAAAKKRTTAE